MTEKQTEKKSDIKSYINLDEYRDQLLNLSFKYPTAHGLLFFLAKNMDLNNIYELSKSKEIFEKVGASEQTIYTNLHVLENLGFIEKIKNDNPNIYHINENLFKKVKGPTK